MNKVKEVLMKSVISWVGGKRLLCKRIAEMIPADINGYIEPFGGAGWVLLHRDRWATLEVYNDLDSRLTNLFLQAKHHPEALKHEFDMLISSRDMFLLLRDNPGLTELQRAARFMYLINRSFGAKGDNYATSKTRAQASMINKLELLTKLSERLDKVIIENRDYRDIIKNYDHKDNFFYCDPPYMTGCTYANSKDFDHKVLFDILSNIKGRFLLSYDDCEQARRLYQDFNTIPVTRVKGINRMHGKSDYKELLISNYAID